LPTSLIEGVVEDEGMKRASDALESDAQGRIYATDYEWPGTMSVADDGYLYFTANQPHRQPDYHDGRDLRVKPYRLFRVKIDGTPVLLR